MSVLLESNLPGLPVRRGKVRDVYDLDTMVPGALLIVASDRISAFDVIMPTGIPDKGKILTQLSNFWFNQFSGDVSHHLLETDFSAFPAALRRYEDQLRGRSILVKKTSVIPIECVVRGYLAGGGWAEYLKTGTVSGMELGPGLRQAEQLRAPIFTPSTKAERGHDAPISFEAAAERFGRPLLETLRTRSIELYTAGAALARSRGIILADTKFEFGLLPNQGGASDPILIDEIFTPDSSRFWPADTYEVGQDQSSFDKQFLRNYLEALVKGGAWHKQPPGPELPEVIVAQTRARYVEAYERLTGGVFGVHPSRGA